MSENICPHCSAPLEVRITSRGRDYLYCSVCEEATEILMREGETEQWCNYCAAINVFDDLQNCKICGHKSQEGNK